MAAFVFARHLFFGRFKVLFPLTPALDVDEDFRPHELDDLDPEMTLAGLDGRIVDLELFGHCTDRFPFGQKLDHGLVPC